MPADPPRAIALRRFTEVQRDHGALDPEIIFDILLDAIEHPTPEMLKAGEEVLLYAVPTLPKNERQVLASVLWRAMWEVIE